MSEAGPWPPEAHRFARWLRAGLSGCEFAKWMAKENRSPLYFMLVDTPKREDLPLIEQGLDDAAQLRGVAILLSPRARTHADAAKLCRLLCESDRWSATRQPYSLAPKGCAGLKMTWKTKAGTSSAAMGFAPFGEMPVTRRAPYLALALWTGDRANQFFDKGRPNTVNMAHAHHTLKRHQHDRLWKSTVQEVETMLADPPESAKELHDVSFCLRASTLHWTDRAR